MSVRAKSAELVVICASVLLHAGCAQPTPEEIVAGLSYAVLVPERSCEELRAAFGLEHLPLVDDPTGLGLDYEEALVPNGLGAQLRVWYIPAEGERGVVVISSGSTGTLPCFLYLPSLLHERGWSIVMYEYQGFGHSSGVADLVTLRPDLRAVLRWTVARTGRPQVTLYGQSIGSIPTIALAAERPQTVNAVVLDSPVAMGVELERFGARFAQQTRAVLMDRDPALITEEIVAQVGQPLLVFLHEQDVVTPPKSVELLFDRAAGPKELVRFPGLDHSQGLYRESETYLLHLDAFLGRVWQPAETGS